MDDPDETQRRALVCNIAHRLLLRALDEVMVFDDLLVRLERGAENYGALDLLSDRRQGDDWDTEADEEISDFQIYRSMKRVQRRKRERLRLQEAVRAELAAIAEFGDVDAAIGEVVAGLSGAQHGMVVVKIGPRELGEFEFDVTNIGGEG